MLKLSTEPLGRLMRVDEPLEELGISTYDRLRDAVKAGDKETTLKLIDYLQIEWKGDHDIYGDVTYALLTWIADNCGEEKLLEVNRFCKEKVSLAIFNQLGTCSRTTSPGEKSETRFLPINSSSE